MAVDDRFEVAAEISIQRYGRATFLEDPERFAEQAGTGRVGRQEPRNDTLARFDEDLIAIGRESQDSIEIACRRRARDVNDRHETIVARIQEFSRSRSLPCPKRGTWGTRRY